MKRFGVQLAASGIVILLGALGVAQSQRESSSSSSAVEELQSLPEMSPPPPISAMDEEPAADASGAPGTFGFSGFGMPAASPAGESGDPQASIATPRGAVRTVAHEEPIDEAAAAPGFAMPAGPAPAADGADLGAAAPPSMPGWSMPAADPAASETASPSPESAPPAAAFAAPPAAAFTAPPSLGMSGFGLPASSNDQSAAPPASAALSVPVNEMRSGGDSAGAFASGLPADDAAPVEEDGLGEDSLSADGGADQPQQLPTLQFAQGPGASAGFEPTQDSDAYQQPPAADGGAFANQSPNQEMHAAPVEQLGRNDSLDNGAPSLAMEPEPDAIPINGNAMNPPSDAAPLSRIASLPTSPMAAAGIGAQSGAHLRGMAAGPELDELVLAEPGDRRLEGTQTPSVVIQKRAPEEVKVGKPAAFVIAVQNVGGVEALDVRVMDRVPAGMRLVDATPTPNVAGDLLTWELGALEPGGERTVTMQLVPEQEGELGSVARVTFEAAASVRTISTRPALKITQRAPEKVLIGQQLEIEIEVSNPGTGAATGVVLQEDVPEGLEHPKGRQLDNVIGTLAPGEVRRQVLRLRAVAPGPVQNLVRLVADDGLETQDAVNVDVVAPQLAIELEGPSRRFLERQAVFNINLANVGTADATNVEVVAYLDRGFSFVGTEYQGQYDPNRHAVFWSLAELPVEGRGSVPLRLLPVEQGDRAIRLEARGDLNVLAQYEKNVSVDTLAELTFSITDDADPIEVGSEATYEIRITNRGSRDDSDVTMQMQLPSGLELVSSEAEASTDGRGMIAFAPTKMLPAGGEIVHRVKVQGVAPGTHIVKAIVTSAQSKVPVTKEESTMVYADQ